MRRIVATSVLFGLALVAVSAAGQKAEDKKVEEKALTPEDTRAQLKKVAGRLAEQKEKADPTDAAIAAALAHDPDVRMARAKVQLAEAELAKARQAVTVKVITLRAAIEEQKQAVAIAQEAFTLVERSHKQGAVPASEVNQARAKLEVARAALARSELELKLITGGGVAGAGAVDPHQGLRSFGQFIGAHKAAACTACHVMPWAESGAEGPKPGAADATARGLDWLANRMLAEKESSDLAIHWYLQAVRGVALDQSTSVRGAVSDRIRAALDKKVRLGDKGEKVPLTRALEVFKTDAGLDVPVRGVGDLVQTPVITSQGEEMTVAAWLQLYQDYSNEGRFYVREYGLLFTHKSMAPPDALTLTQFWEIKPPAKKDEKEKKDDPNKK
jgi:hypothetical protein